MTETAHIILEVALGRALEREEKLKERIENLEDIYLGQIRVIARSRITYKERVERMTALAEQALKGK